MSLRTDQFYLPYQFVPLTGRCNDAPVHTTATAQIADGTLELGQTDSGVRHDLWLRGHHSGRLRCRITTRTPTFVGGLRKPSDHEQADTEVEHACDARRDPVFPGNSLRGMVASIAEALSQSSLRVLEPRTMSVRAPADGKNSLSAIGLVIREPGKKDFALKPLCLPVLQGANASKTQFELPRRWATLFGLEAGDEDYLLNCYLSAYVDGYTRSGDASVVRPGTFLSRLHGSQFRADDAYSLSLRAANGADHELYARVQASRTGLLLNITNSQAAYVKEATRRDGSVAATFLLGWRPEPTTATVAPVARPDGNCNDDELLGRIRALRFAAQSAGLPLTKRHELFVPAPGEDEPLRIDAKKLAEFFRICDSRHAENSELPFVPLGTASPTERAKSKEWLQEGDLVFFDVDESATRVTRLSFSGVWRLAVPGTLDDSIEKIAPHLAPLRDSRNRLSPAECLFGMVRERKDSAHQKETDPLPALASRLRFSEAALEPNSAAQWEPPVTLQILSSPKPPSPAFYFSAKQPVTKRDLDLTRNGPNGRKHYLHHPPAQIAAKLYESRHQDRDLRKQKVRIRPLKPGNRFTFHIDFENLSGAELHLLLTSLQPSPSFDHRLGMGKPLGLGSVRLDILELGLIDRCARYRAEALDQPRHAQIYRGPQAADADLQLAGTPAAALAWPQDGFAGGCGPAGSLVDKATLQILCTLGEMEGDSPRYQATDVVVGYPRTEEQLEAWVRHDDPKAAETELFAWNVENDRKDAVYQHLTAALPRKRLLPLKAMERQRRQGQHPPAPGPRRPPQR